MDNILNQVDELIELIKDNQKYIEYKNLKKKIQEDEEIMNLIKDIKKYQKEIVRNGQNDILENKISTNLEKLDNIPIYVRFNSLQVELNDMFQIIKTSIEKCINDITN